MTDVLVLTNMYPSDEDEIFGSFVRDQVEDIRALGIAVDVLSFDGRQKKSAYVVAAFRLREALARRRPRLIHAHYGLTGAVALTQRRVPVVTTFHGSDTGPIPWQARVSRIVARRCEPIVVEQAAARRLGVPHAHVLPVGVDTERFVIGSASAARRALGWQGDGLYVLLPAQRRNPVKDARLFDAVVSELRSRGVTVSPFSLDGLLRADVPHAFQAADVALLTSKAEGSPLVVREALASGTPVVSVDVGDVARTLAGLPGCAVAPRSPRHLADEVLRAGRATNNEILRSRALETSRPAIAEQLQRIYAATLEAG